MRSRRALTMTARSQCRGANETTMNMQQLLVAHIWCRSSDPLDTVTLTGIPRTTDASTITMEFRPVGYDPRLRDEISVGMGSCFTAMDAPPPPISSRWKKAGRD